MSGRITVTGLVSGIDFNSIITQLIDIERLQRIKPIEKAIAQNDQKLGKLNEFSSLISAVRSAAAKLNTVSGSRPRTATSSDTNKIRISSVGTDAIPGSYPVTQVRSLARAEMIASSLNGGSFNITEEAFTFRIRSNGQNRTVTTTDFSNVDDDKELAQLATDINQDAGDVVTAFVINSGTSSARLVIQSKNTGLSLSGGTEVAGNLGDVAISMAAGSAALTNLGGLGLVSLGYGGTALTTDEQEANTVQTNQDLSLSIGNISVSFDTNVVSSMIPGVALEFLSTFNSGTTTITVNNDTSTLKSNVQALVDAFNNLQQFVKDQTTYDEDLQAAGILQSNTAVRTMRDVVVNALGIDMKAQNTNFRHSADLGITFDRTGLLLFDGSKFDSKMSSNFSDTGEAFRGFKFTTDNFTAADVGPFPTGAISMSFKVKGIQIDVAGTISAGDNETRMKSFRDIINEDGRGILSAKVIEEPDGTLRVALNGDNVLYDEDIASLSSGATEQTMGLVTALGDTAPRNASPSMASRIEDMLKDLIDGTGVAAGLLQSEIDQIGDLNFFYNKRIDQQEAIIVGIEERLKAKFTALESVLASFQSQGDFLSQRLGSISPS